MAPGTRSALPLVVAAATLLGLPPHSLARIKVSHSELAGGPVLAGERVVWGEQRRGGGIVVMAGLPGHRPAPIFRFAPPADPRSSLDFDGLAASRTHVAFIKSTTTVPARRSTTLVQPLETGSAYPSTLVAGPLTGPFRHLSGFPGRDNGRGCRSGVRSPSNLDVDGHVVAYLETVTACRGRDEWLVDRVVVNDLNRGRSPVVVATSSPFFAGGEPNLGLDAVRVAGRFLAWQETRRGGTVTAVVYDWVRRRRAYSLRGVEDRNEVWEILEWFALQRDGKLAVSYHGDGGAHKLAWASPRNRLPRKLSDHAVLSTVDVEFAGNRLAFVGQAPNRDLIVSGLTGRAARVASFTRRRRMVGTFDFDGDRITWAWRRKIHASLGDRARSVTTIYLERVDPLLERAS